MRLPCPFCGFRDVGEFVSIGEANGARPDPDAPDAPQKFFTYAYLRTNSPGPSEEYWYHAFGCRAWLKVMRDPLTHAVESAVLAQENAK